MVKELCLYLLFLLQGGEHLLQATYFTMSLLEGAFPQEQCWDESDNLQFVFLVYRLTSHLIMKCPQEYSVR